MQVVEHVERTQQVGRGDLAQLVRAKVEDVTDVIRVVGGRVAAQRSETFLELVPKPVTFRLLNPCL